MNLHFERLWVKRWGRRRTKSETEVNDEASSEHLFFGVVRWLVNLRPALHNGRTEGEDIMSVECDVHQ